jgi:putative membrane protein
MTNFEDERIQIATTKKDAGIVYTLVSGFMMALADSVPGVSGGTIAFVMGFYDNFITALYDIFHGNRQEKKSALFYLTKLAAGWLIGMGLAVSVLAGLFTTGIYQVSSLFLGFVLASIPLIMIEEKEAVHEHCHWLFFTSLGAAVVVGLSVFNLSSYVQNLGLTFGTALYVMLAGFLAISAMVLPGISGSTLLMTFGLYVPVITALKEVINLNFTNLWLVVLLTAGILLGIAISLKVIKTALLNHRSSMVYAILGMMIGSLYAIVVGPTTLKVPQHVMGFADLNIWLFLTGAAIVYGLYLLKQYMSRKKAMATDGSDSEY